jgi:hypothetical protein
MYETDASIVERMGIGLQIALLRNEKERSVMGILDLATSVAPMATLPKHARPNLTEFVQSGHFKMR